MLVHSILSLIWLRMMFISRHAWRHLTKKRLVGIGRSLTLLSMTLLYTLISSQLVRAEVSGFESGLAGLTSKDFSQIAQAIEQLEASGDPRTEMVLNYLLNGELYRHKKRNSLVLIIEKNGKNYQIRELFSGQQQASETVRSRAVKKVAVNNQIRRAIKIALARISLASGDTTARRDAITLMMGQMNSVIYQELSHQLSHEPDEDLKALIQVALAVYALNHSDEEQQKLRAIETLGASYQPMARNALTQFLATEPPAQLAKQATKSLGLIEQRAKVAAFGETVFFGLSLGSVLVLAAIGLAITFGVMGVINMAHGELMMIGAYTTYVIQTLLPNHIGWSILLSIPAAFVVSGCVGIMIERGVMRFLYGRPLETLLATFGISLILQQAVRSIFSPLNRSVSSPDWMQGVIEINPLLSLTLNRLYIIGFCLIVFALLFAVLRYTRLGLEVRAVSQNRHMARAMGVRSQWVDAMTFGLGSGIAGIAGVALSQLTNVGPNLGQAYIIDSFMVVVFGGVGNLWGTLVAGMSLGIANKVLEPWAGAVLAKILMLVFIILFIQKKPRGLFPQKGRSAEG